MLLFWGDGTSSTLRSLSRVAHVYRHVGTFNLSLKFISDGKVVGQDEGGSPIIVQRQRRTVLPVAPGLSMVDLNAVGMPFIGDGTVSRPVISADGRYIAWVYDHDHGNVVGDYGLVWRDLTTGQTIQWRGIYPYSLSMSGNGRHLAYTAAAATASDGDVTGVNIWLLDTTTGTRKVINRLTSGQIAGGDSNSVNVSADEDYIVFDSDSRTLAPDGVTRSCPSGVLSCGPWDVYLYNRQTQRLEAVPLVAALKGPAGITFPVVSGDGGVVAFRAQGVGPNGAIYLWFTQAGVVRPVTVDAADQGFVTSGQVLAISEAGNVLASALNGDAVALGGTSGPDTLEWQFPTSGNPYEDSVALSEDGDAMAILGPPGPAGWGQWPVWQVQLPAGQLSLASLPPIVPGLAPEATSGGMADDSVSMSADGSKVVAVACSLGDARATDSTQSCPGRTDVFLWQPAAFAASEPDLRDQEPASPSMLRRTGISPETEGEKRSPCVCVR